MTVDLTAYRRQWFSDGAAARRDILAGIVVALALIPEAIGFSIIAGVDSLVGLYASAAIAIVIALIGGRPGMMSASTAAVAVQVVPLVRTHDLSLGVLARVLLSGIFFAGKVQRIFSVEREQTPDGGYAEHKPSAIRKAARGRPSPASACQRSPRLHGSSRTGTPRPA